jgi:acrylyl-CoA reductase (NADPH)
MKEKYSAIVVKKYNNRIEQLIEYLNINDLPSNDVLIRVHYSAINYKDCMSFMGNLGVTRKFPHTPGIDAAGIVVSSKDQRFEAGDRVLIVSRQMGLSQPGGFGQYVTCPAEWVEKIPPNLSLRDSMIFGTAGLTAACAIEEIENSVKTLSKANIAVTGATGGVGILSSGILAKLGYKVTAISGKKNVTDIFNSIGVTNILDRSCFIDNSDRGLLSEEWSIGIDTVGGSTLSTLIRHLRHSGDVYSTGIVSSQKIEVSLLPFILRGVSLKGINMESKDLSTREKMWQNLGGRWRPLGLEKIAIEIGISEISYYVDKILSGNNIGRIIINMK